MDQLVEEQAVGKLFVGDDHIHKGHCGSVSKAGQIANAHQARHAVKRRILNSLAVKNKNAAKGESFRREERLHRRKLLRRERNSIAHAFLASAEDEILNRSRELGM